MNVETIRLLEEQLEGMSQQELNKFTRQIFCQKMYSNQQQLINQYDPSTTLDLIHSEYLRRGLEKHYDMTCESVSKNPDVCDAA